MASLTQAAEQKYRLSDIPTPEEKARMEKNERVQEESATGSEAEVAHEMANEFYQLGLKALNEGNLEQAEGYFDRALILKPNHKEAKDSIEYIMQTYEQPKEKTVLPKPSTPDPERSEPRPKTIPVLKERTEEDLKKSDLLYLEALSANQTGNTEDALKLCKRALVLNPNNLQAKRMLQRLVPKSTP